ncbi:MAG: AmmeMemoRadiSam system protein B [Candidatus Pacearchaeota archaeon]
MTNWYPQDKDELNKLVDSYLNQELNLKVKPFKINGLIVPHAGYEYSGSVAGKAFSLLKNKKIEKAIILGPSHYIPLTRVVTSDQIEWSTPLGKIKLYNKDFPTTNIEEEHSIKNQVPFLQKIGIKKIMPLMVGKIMPEQAKSIAEKIFKEPAVFVFSTDLSHFKNYEIANKIDKSTIKIIQNLEIENFQNIDACGFYPLLIMMYLCKLLNVKPNLIEYKNSGDITGDKYHGVVGYASFWF